MSDVNVVIIGSFPDEIQTRIRSAFPADWDVQIAAPESVAPFLSTADVIIPEHEPIDRALLEKAPKVRMIQTGSGYDNVDLEECRRRGITVCTAAGVNAAAVADHTMALILAWYKNIPYLDHCMKTRVPWENISYAGAELSDLTAGIVGAGRIGRKTAALCNAFGMRVLTCGRVRQNDRRNRKDMNQRRPVSRGSSKKDLAGLRDGGLTSRDGNWDQSRDHRPKEDAKASVFQKQVDLDTLLHESDVISIHVPLTEETRGMFHKGTFLKMKRTAVLVNTSRGGVVKEDDLIAALKSRTIAGACLDVFSQEPLPQDSPLRDLPNVILTPHTAGLPDGAHYHAKRYAFFAENIRRFMIGEEPENCVR